MPYPHGPDELRSGKTKALIEAFISGGKSVRLNAYSKLCAKPSTSRLLLLSKAQLTNEQKSELAENAYKLAKLYTSAGSSYGPIYAVEILQSHPHASQDLKRRLEKLSSKLPAYLRRE